MDSESALATARVTLSVTDPAGKGATKVMGRDGKSCAAPGRAHNSVRAGNRARKKGLNMGQVSKKQGLLSLAQTPAGHSLDFLNHCFALPLAQPGPAQTMVVTRVPICAMLTSTRSWADSHKGGVRKAPMPAGVPVASTSPGSSVMYWLR